MNRKVHLFLIFIFTLASFYIIPTLHNAASAQDNLTSGYPDFSNLAERLLPTVVNVSTTTKLDKKQMVMQQLPEELLKELGPFKDLFESFNQGRGRDSEGSNPNNKISSLGSGFIIDAEKGYVVTNNHVIDGADEIQVILNDNTTIDAKLVGKDEKTDIALLKVETKEKLVAATWGDSDQLKIGSWVLAIGNPFGLGGTVTAGIVSARERDINSGPYDDYIQTDASINRGNSGGPMFNTKGEVVGINTAIFSTMGGGSIGIGFAVPANMAKDVIDQLIKYGSTKRGWLGVNIQPVTPEIAESLGLEKSMGAMVASVTPDSPSENAGIETGDVILKFDGKKIEEMKQLPRQVASAEVGKKVEVVVWHKGKEKTVYVTLGQLETAEKDGLVEKPESINSKKSNDDNFKIKDLGLSLASITPELRSKYRFDDSVKGVIITEIDPDSSAAQKDIRPGDVILEFEQQKVSTPKEIAKLVQEVKDKNKSSVLLFVSRDDNKLFVALKLKQK